MRLTTSLSYRVMACGLFLGLCSWVYAAESESEQRQYTVLVALSDTEGHAKEGSAFLDIIVDIEGQKRPIRHFLYYTSATKACPKKITPESLEKGVRLVGGTIEGDVFAVKSNKWDLKKPSEPKTIYWKVLDELGVWSNDYREIPVQLEFNFNQESQQWRWELKYKNVVAKSAKFVTEGENRIKQVLFGDGAICETTKDGKTICKDMGKCTPE